MHEEISSKLKNTLATLQVHRANIQGAHWNMRGCHSFLTFHKYFDQMYEENSAHIDFIAEAIRILGQNPNYTLTKFLARSYISEATPEQVIDFEKTLKKALEDNQRMLELSKKLFSSSAAYPDINDYAAGMVADFGKRVWFLKSSIVEEMEEKKEEPNEESSSYEED